MPDRTAAEDNRIVALADDYAEAVALEVLAVAWEHRLDGVDCVCGWQPAGAWTLADVLSQHRAHVIAAWKRTKAGGGGTK